MLKRKFIRQENIKDCGAACLLMIIKHYGGNYPLERLREMMKMDKNGTTALNLIETAKEVGFDARGYKCSDYSKIKCPSIAHVIIDKTYHHFVVIDKVDLKKKTIKIADPALGIKKYSFSEFSRIWTSVIITLYPIRKIDNVSTIQNVKKTLYQLITPYKKLFIYIFMFSIIYTALNIIGTLYFKLIIDNTTLSIASQVYLFSIFLLVAVIKIVTDYARTRLLVLINQKIDKRLMEHTFKHLLSLPWQYFNSRTTGDIVARLNDLSYVRELISRLAIILFVDLILVGGSIIAMWYLNTNLFLLTILIIVIYIVVIYFFNQSIKHMIMKNQENDAKVSSVLVESISGISTIKNLGIENQIYQKGIKNYHELVDSATIFNKKYTKIKMIKDFIINLGIILIIFLGGILISEGKLSIGEFVMFNFFLTFFIEPMKNLLDVEPLLRASANALKRTSEFFNIEKDDVGSIKELKNGSIEVKNLSFAYNDNEVVKGINFRIDNGEKIMINGPSGVGKSTIAKMLMRYLDVKENQIMINNVDILKYSLGTIRENICYISQNEIIFTDTLHNNVVLDRDIEKSEIDKIFKVMNLNDIIEKHNLDEYMLLEENGYNLSGGEKQRIMIARALLKKSEIFIFDESMSEMNVSLERTVLNNIFDNYSDKTFIVISHRLDNADLYDRVIMVNDLKELKEESVCV